MNDRLTYKCRYGDISYEWHGPEEAPVVAFIHGVGMDRRTFLEQAEALKDNYRVLLWDLPGHGESTLGDYDTRFTRLSADCLQELLMEHGVGSAVLVGQSLGSIIAQYFLLRHPGLAKASVHVPGVELKSHAGRWARPFVPLMTGLFKLMPEGMFCRSFGRHRAVRKEVQRYLSETMANTGMSLAMKITRDMMYDLIDQSPAPAKRPLLITCGRKDLFFIRRGCRGWHRRTAGSRYAEIDHANHIANQDNPARFNQVLRGFLEEIG
jgi:pimeloyl-ACP methyl ester carboxylesterase